MTNRSQCDETRPGCTRCRKAGITCPGYRKKMIIKHYDAFGSRTNHYSSKPQRTDRMKRVEEVQLCGDSFGARLVNINNTLSLSSPTILGTFWNQAESMLLFALSPDWQILPPSQRHTGIWLEEVVCRARKDILLSHSIRALSSLYIGSITGAKDMTLIGQSHYAAALRIMQISLSGSTQDVSNIQSAAMLLTFFEVWITYSEYFLFSKQN